MKKIFKKQIDFKIEKLTRDNRDFLLDNLIGDTELTYIDDFLKDQNAIGYFVFSENNVLGYIHGYKLTRLKHSPMLYIHNMSVKNKYRHLGIGTLMMETMKQYAKQHNLSKIFLLTSKSNERAVALFEKEKGKVPHQDDMVFVWENKDF